MTPLCLDVKQTAESLGVSVWVVRRLIADGALAAVKLPSTKYAEEKNRRVLIAVADLEAFVAKHREVPR